MSQFCLNARFILGQDEPPRQMGVEDRLIGTPQRLAMAPEGGQKAWLIWISQAFFASYSITIPNRRIYYKLKFGRLSPIPVNEIIKRAN